MVEKLKDSAHQGPSIFVLLFSLFTFSVFFGILGLGVPKGNFRKDPKFFCGCWNFPHPLDISDCVENSKNTQYIFCLALFNQRENLMKVKVKP